MTSHTHTSVFGIFKSKSIQGRKQMDGNDIDTQNTYTHINTYIYEYMYIYRSTIQLSMEMEMEMEEIRE